MYNKTGLYALLLVFAWLGPVVLFHGLAFISDQFIPTQSFQQYYQIHPISLYAKLSQQHMEPISSAMLLAQSNVQSAINQSGLGINSCITDTQDSVIYHDTVTEVAVEQECFNSEQLEEIAQQLQEIEQQLVLEGNQVLSEQKRAKLEIIEPEIREPVQDQKQVITKSKKQIKLEKKQEQLARKAELKKVKEHKRLQKQLKKQNCKAKRRQLQEQQEQKLLIKQVAKEHKQKAMRSAATQYNYQDSNLVKKQVEQKLELVQLQVDDLYQVVFKHTHLVTVSELLALLQLLLIQKKEYALLQAQVMALSGFQSIDGVATTMRDLEFRIQAPFEKIRDRLYLLFGAVIDTQMGEQYFINNAQQELSDQMQEVQQLLQLQLSTIGKEGLQEHIFNAVQQEVAGLNQELMVLRRTIETQIPLLEQSKKQDFIDQMESVIMQKKRAIESVKNIYKDMLVVSKLKQIGGV